MNVYIFSILLTCSLLLGLKVKSNSKWLFVIALLPMILLAGFRYDVGIDFQSYWDVFLHADSYLTEFGHRALCLLLSMFGFGPQMIFLLYAFVITYFTCKTLSGFFPQYLCLICLLYFVSDYFASMNIMRQYMATIFFLYSIRYIRSRSVVKYFTCILLAACFHYSALFLLPFYWLLGINFSKSVIWIILIFVVVISMFFPVASLLVGIPKYGEYIGLAVNSSANLGLGFLSRLIVLVLMVFLKDRIISKNAYSLYIINGIFFSICIALLFKDFIVFLRLSYYFQILFPVAIALLLDSLTYKSKLLMFPVVVSYAFLLLMASCNTEAKTIPYQYNWDLFQTKFIEY